jgi:hypothetical protein
MLREGERRGGMLILKSVLFVFGNHEETLTGYT